MTLKYSHKIKHCPNMVHNNKSTKITKNKSKVFIDCLNNTDHQRLDKSIVYSLIATTQVIVKLHLKNCLCCHIQVLANRWLSILPSVELVNWLLLPVSWLCWLSGVWGGVNGFQLNMVNVVDGDCLVFTSKWNKCKCFILMETSLKDEIEKKLQTEKLQNGGKPIV